MNDESADVSSKSKPADEPVFKVPEIPRKIRKLQNKASSKIDPAIIANVEAINKMTSPEKARSPPPSSSSPVKCPATPKKLNPKPADRKSKAKVKAKRNHGTQFTATKTEPLTEVGALLNAVVEKNTRKVTEYIRTSLSGILNEFWDTTKPTHQLQKLQEQMAAMRSTYGGQIDVLQSENTALKQDLDSLNGKYGVQLEKIRETMRENEKLSGLLCATKSKMSVMTMDLNKSNSK